MKNEIVIFEDQNIKLEVNMKDENDYLGQKETYLQKNAIYKYIFV